MISLKPPFVQMSRMFYALKCLQTLYLSETFSISHLFSDEAILIFIHESE